MGGVPVEHWNKFSYLLNANDAIITPSRTVSKTGRQKGREKIWGLAAGPFPLDCESCVREPALFCTALARAPKAR